MDVFVYYLSYIILKTISQSKWGFRVLLSTGHTQAHWAWLCTTEDALEPQRINPRDDMNPSQSVQRAVAELPTLSQVFGGQEMDSSWRNQGTPWVTWCIPVNAVSESLPGERVSTEPSIECLSCWIRLWTTCHKTPLCSQMSHLLPAVSHDSWSYISAACDSCVMDIASFAKVRLVWQKNPGRKIEKI